MSIEFQKVGDVHRSVYPQFGGSFVLADECRCRVEWGKHRPEGLNFSVSRSIECPLDEHRQEALNGMQGEKISTSDAQRCKTTS